MLRTKKYYREQLRKSKSKVTELENVISDLEKQNSNNSIFDLHITVGSSSGNSLFSKIIKYWTKSKISHFWLAFTIPIINERVVIGAEGHGVDWRTIEKFEKSNKIMLEFKPIGPNLNENLKWMIQTYSGAKYDYKGVGTAGIFIKFRLLFRKIGGWLLKNLSSKDKVFCSELIVRFLAHNNLYKAVEEHNPEITDAETLQKQCLIYDDEFRLIYNHKLMDEYLSKFLPAHGKK